MQYKSIKINNYECLSFFDWFIVCRVGFID
ncbi:MAG: hypothetical protein JWP78_1192 [Mucilaginibacter sp.]|nr:hypothetical protein [Mucilaginibacter sp.]